MIERLRTRNNGEKMSGECNGCGEHCLDCACPLESQIKLTFDGLVPDGKYVESMRNMCRLMHKWTAVFKPELITRKDDRLIRAKSKLRRILMDYYEGFEVIGAHDDLWDLHAMLNAEETCVK